MQCISYSSAHQVVCVGAVLREASKQKCVLCSPKQNCCGAAAAEKARTNSTLKFWQSPRCLCFSLTQTSGCFSTHLLLQQATHNISDGLLTHSVHVCVAGRTPILVYYQQGPSHTFLERGEMEMDTCPLLRGVRGRGPPLWHGAAGIPGLAAQHHGRIVMQWSPKREGLFVKMTVCVCVCVCVCVSLAHAMRQGQISKRGLELPNQIQSLNAHNGLCVYECVCVSLQCTCWALLVHLSALLLPCVSSASTVQAIFGEMTSQTEAELISLLSAAASKKWVSQWNIWRGLLGPESPKAGSGLCGCPYRMYTITWVLQHNANRSCQTYS